jgi:hypothetical protein
MSPTRGFLICNQRGFMKKFESPKELEALAHEAGLTTDQLCRLVGCVCSEEHWSKTPVDKAIIVISMSKDERAAMLQESMIFHFDGFKLAKFFKAG